MKTQNDTNNYSQFFITDKRSDGGQFYKLNKEAPEDLQKLLFNIHKKEFDQCLANDWIYQTALEAFEELENDNLHYLSIDNDIWDKDLAKWLQEPFAEEFCQEAQAEGYVTDKTTIFKHIAYGQRLAKWKIYASVDNFLNENGEV
jgi:hypothetical protein